MDRFTKVLFFLMKAHAVMLLVFGVALCFVASDVRPGKESNA